MTLTREAYENHNFIQTSINLLCAGASWKGGKFITSTDNLRVTFLPDLDEMLLEQLAKTLLLDGQTHLEVLITEGNVSISQKPEQNSTKGKKIIIERTENISSPNGSPILERDGQNIQMYTEALSLSLSDPNRLKSLNLILPGIHSALGISSLLLDQSKFAQIPVEALMAGVIRYKSEVNRLRNNLRFGLNRIGEYVEEVLDIEGIIWDWNADWLPSGHCKYGHVYQVFKSKGILLDPIMNSEIGGMKLALDLGISNRTYSECEESYGIK